MMGWPPAHIHHMHVTSSQTMMTTWTGGRVPQGAVTNPQPSLSFPLPSLASSRG